MARVIGNRTHRTRFWRPSRQPWNMHSHIKEESRKGGTRNSIYYTLLLIFNEGEKLTPHERGKFIFCGISNQEDNT